MNKEEYVKFWIQIIKKDDKMIREEELKTSKVYKVNFKFVQG